MTPSDRHLAAMSLNLQVRKHERMGVPFQRACRIVADDMDMNVFEVRAAVVRYRESLGGPSALLPDSLTASEYAEILTSGAIVDAILAAFNNQNERTR